MVRAILKTGDRDVCAEPCVVRCTVQKGAKGKRRKEEFPWLASPPTTYEMTPWPPCAPAPRRSPPTPLCDPTALPGVCGSPTPGSRRCNRQIKSAALSSVRSSAAALAPIPCVRPDRPPGRMRVCNPGASALQHSRRMFGARLRDLRGLRVKKGERQTAKGERNFK